MGTMLDRTERILTDDDLAKIAGTYHAWRGTASARETGLKYKDTPGFCYSRTSKMSASTITSSPRVAT